MTLDGMTSRYVDLSHPIQHEMITYPGLPGPTISTYVSGELPPGSWRTPSCGSVGRAGRGGDTGRGRTMSPWKPGCSRRLG